MCLFSAAGIFQTQADITRDGEYCEKSDGGEEKVSTRVSRGKMPTRGKRVRYSAQKEVSFGVRTFRHLLCTLQVSWVLALFFPMQRL